MVIVFDLDNTLFDELAYVKSGFRAVAKFLSSEKNISEKQLYNQFLKRFAFGRGTIFDDVLKQNNIFSKQLVKRCISVYRLHKPNIKLFSDAKLCLKRFSKYPIYIVTDGNKTVQANKIKALNLHTKVKKVFITYRYGIKHSKPSPYCFLKICQLEKVTPDNVVYIGDNPAKDFVGIKPLGFKTIRILRGYHSHEKKTVKYEAHYNIKTLNELTSALLNNLINK